MPEPETVSLKEQRLHEAIQSYPHAVDSGRIPQAREGPALTAALTGDLVGIEHALQVEQASCRAGDRAYWQPLRDELFHWRQARRKLR